MKPIHAIFCMLAIFLSFQPVAFAQKLEKKFDQMLNKKYPENGPGATALVAKNGRITYHKAFGMASMELDVTMQKDMVFEIGSITKQFTAVAILMLMERGKLNLDDSITKFLEDYPTHGHNLTIHHLLTHTSGIKSYTSMEKWAKEWRTDYTPKELIDFFKNQPMDFAPGEEYEYNNSAYFILGYIIEKASGISYESFIEENIFKPLKMSNSYYGSQSKIIKKRAQGYQRRDGYVNAEYLSLTQPYAAGSLMSTVEDLFLWNRAIRANTLVSKESLALAFTNYKLNNEKKINYGYGWVLSDINGSPTIEHGGGIFGFATNSIYLPDEDIFVAVFSNCDCNPPGTVSTRIAALALNKPYPDPSDYIPVKNEILDTWVGVYDFEDGATRVVTREENQLYSQRTGGTRYKIFPMEKNTFAFENSFATLRFKAKDNQIHAYFASRTEKTDGLKTDRPIPKKKVTLVDLSILESYVGVYSLAPNFDITITLEQDKLMSQATGQEKFQVYPESKTRFFYKVVDAQIEFAEKEDGVVKSFTLFQNGQQIIANRKD